MPYPAGRRTDTKRKIVKSARSLFNRHGFDKVSLDQIMSGAGLTRGGFYNYFQTKDDLYPDVLGYFQADPPKVCWNSIKLDLNAPDAGAQIIGAYLSREHFEDIEDSCPMITLSNDVARGGISAKRGFQAVFSGMVGIVERSAAKDPRARRRAQAAVAMCVGGMAVARATADRKAADEIREACLSTALELAGWGPDTKPTRRAPSPTKPKGRRKRRTAA
jgi:TetR/AcrR family transcriptional regulator, transcriptional repressor for nem operon